MIHEMIYIYIYESINQESNFKICISFTKCSIFIRNANSVHHGHDHKLYLLVELK